MLIKNQHSLCFIESHQTDLWYIKYRINFMYVMQVYYICRFYVKMVVTDVYCIIAYFVIKQCVF